MATAKNELISQLDRAAHRLGVNLVERGLNRRILSLTNVNWDMTNNGDRIQVKRVTLEGVILGEERMEAEYVIEVMESMQELISVRSNRPAV